MSTTATSLTLKRGLDRRVPNIAEEPVKRFKSAAAVTVTQPEPEFDFDCIEIEITPEEKQKWEVFSGFRAKGFLLDNPEIRVSNSDKNSGKEYVTDNGAFLGFVEQLNDPEFQAPEYITEEEFAFLQQNGWADKLHFRGQVSIINCKKGDNAGKQLFKFVDTSIREKGASKDVIIGWRDDLDSCVKRTPEPLTPMERKMLYEIYGKEVALAATVRVNLKTKKPEHDWISCEGVPSIGSRSGLPLRYLSHKEKQTQ
jgi:hypothetical protein